mgnify:CR=1 FL=1
MEIEKEWLKKDMVYIGSGVPYEELNTAKTIEVEEIRKDYSNGNKIERRTEQGIR